MSFYKQTIVSLASSDVNIIEPELIKTAAFQLPDGVLYDPDFLYIQVKGVSAGEIWGPNKNNDWFPREELRQAYPTFLMAHVFKNHENKDIKNAIGDVLRAEYDEDMDFVRLLLRIDSKIAPSITRGFMKGYMTDVSMGCRVHHSVCSICGNVAKTPREYCEHVRFERGKVYDDGRKVFEINIGPKFHDISAVLNGAEKTAKALHIYVPGKQAAAKMAGMEKAASWVPPLDTMAKQAEIELSSLFQANMSKRAFSHKVAELQKDIEGKIIEISDQQVDQDLQDSEDDARAVLRLFCEDYWDKETCEEVADRLRRLAEERNVSLEGIFGQFLTVLTFCGCELSPKEYRQIFLSLFCPEYEEDSDEPCEEEAYRDEDEDTFDRLRATRSQLQGDSYDFLPRAVSAMRAADAISAPRTSPATAVRGLAIIAASPKRNLPPMDDMTSVLQERFLPMLQERSVFMPSLLKRAECKKPRMDQFLMKTAHAQDDIINAMYFVYQNDRVHTFYDAVMQEKAAEFAMSGMEKTAISRARYMINSFPVVFGYSNYQKSRMRNGEDISSLNRLIAEHPTMVYMTQGVFVPKTLKNLKKGMKQNLPGVTQNAKKALHRFADLQSNIRVADYVLNGMEKCASSVNYQRFPSSLVDEAILSRYNKVQNIILKMAAVMTALGDTEASDLILQKQGLSNEDVDQYIVLAKDAIANATKDQFRKQASQMRDFSPNAIPDSMDFIRVALQTYADLSRLCIR